MKYLIVGLGNIGAEYENTRHNAGFKVLDALANEFGVTFTSSKLVNLAVAKFKGKTLVLIKPTTYMNASGKAVRYYMQAEKIPLENLMVVVDDLALPYGKLRMKSKGSDGGHNGLKDIQACIETQEYTRLRFGIANDYRKGGQVDYVLGEWTKEEKVTFDERVKTATEFIKDFVTIGTERTMCLMNNK